MRILGRPFVLMPTALALVTTMALSCGRKEPARAATHAEPKPVPAGLKIQTERQYAAVRLRWRWEVTVEAYRAVGRRDPAWDDAAVNLLEAYARWVGQQPGAPNAEQLMAAARPLMDTKCDDPLVLYCIGTALAEVHKPNEAEPYMRRVVEEYEASRYPRVSVWAAPYNLAEVCKAIGGDKAQEQDKWLNEEARWIGEAVRGYKWTGPERRVLWAPIKTILDGDLEPKAKQVYEALTSKPGADEWFINMAGGTYRISEAWKARGSGWASSVKEQGWKTFSEQLELARAHLVKAWKLHPDYPEAADLMILVACGLDDDRATRRLWFDRSVAAQFDYISAYESYLQFALTPRWGGSHREMYDFGLECLATKRFDTEVPAQLWHTVFLISEFDGDETIWRQPGVYQNLRAVFEGMAAEPSRAKEVPQIRAREAALAWRCGAYNDARRLVDGLGGKIPERRPRHTAFEDEYRGSTESALSEIYAATGPFAAQVRKAEELYQQGNVAGALPTFKRVLHDNADRRAEGYLRSRTESCRIEHDFKTGKWVALTPSLDAWRAKHGQWSVDSDGSVRTTDPDGWVSLICAARMPRDFEMRAEVELKPTWGTISGGAICGLDRMNSGLSTYVVTRTDGRTTMYASDRVVESKLMKRLDRDILTIQVWDHKLAAYVNGESIDGAREFECDLKPSSPAQVGLMAYGPPSSIGAVLFHHVQVRSLEKAPPPPSTQPSSD